MKDLFLMLFQIVAVACILGFIFSLLNYFFDFSLGFKGAEVPADLRATALFAVLGGACAGVVYFAGRKSAGN